MIGSSTGQFGGARYPEVRLPLENNELSNRRSWHGNRLHATELGRPRLDW